MKKSEEKPHELAPESPSNTMDGGFSWLIICIAFVGQGMSVGFYFCYGPIYVAVIETFGANENDAAWIGSIGYNTCFVVGSVTSILCNKLGCGLVTSLGGALVGLGMLASSFAPNVFTLYITYGVITSMGTSCLFFASLLSLPLYFQSKLGLANGIASTGSGAMGLALSPFFASCIKQYGLRPTFQMYSVLALLPIIGGFFIKRRAEEKGDWKLSSCFDKSLLTNQAFILFTLAMTLILFVYYVPYVHLISFSCKHGIEKQHAALLTSITSASAIFGKIIFGYVSMLRRVNRLYLFQGFILFLSVSLTLLPLATNYIALAMFAAIFGINEGGFSSFIIIATSYTVHSSQVAVAFGMMYTVASILAYCGAPFAALLYTMTGSYELTFFVSGGIMLLGSFSLFFIPYFVPEDVYVHRKTIKHSIIRKIPEDDDDMDVTANKCDVIVTIDNSDDVINNNNNNYNNKDNQDTVLLIQPKSSRSSTHINSLGIINNHLTKHSSTLSIFSHNKTKLGGSSLFLDVMHKYLQVSENTRTISMAVIPPYVSQDYINKYMTAGDEVDAL